MKYDLPIKEYNVSYDTISRRLKDNNIKRKRVGNKVTHYVNHNINVL